MPSLIPPGLSHMRKRSRGGQSFRGHPSRRPPSAAPQDEGCFRGEILYPHGEGAAKPRVSNHEADTIVALEKSNAIALPNPPPAAERPSLPSSVIDLHSQSPGIEFAAANTRRAVARGNGAGTGVDQIVAADTGAVTLRQPLCEFDETLRDEELDALFAAGRGLLS